MIDYRPYQIDAYRYFGSDAKKCIKYENKYYMIKLPNDQDVVNSLQTSISNNVISEYIGSHIMQLVDIEAQNTELGFWDNEVVVACEDFTSEKERLHEFSWYMQDVISKSEIGRIPTYKQLYRTFNECLLLKDIREEAIARYWDIIIVDALIGNFDRHKDNFGFLANVQTGKVRNAPVYDCGSCLYPNLSEDKLNYILSSEEEIMKRIYDFPKMALNQNDSRNKENKFKYYDFISSGMDKNCTEALIRILPRIELSKINNCIDETPYISESRKNFYKKMIDYRKKLILDKAYKELQSQGIINMQIF